MVGHLTRIPGVVSVFQIGGVNNPGISDIDLAVVFEDGHKVCGDPCGLLSQAERYLFTHALFGINRGNFADASRYSFFHNYRLLAGESLPETADDADEDARITFQRHVAIEYLCRMYINMVVEKTFRIIKLRNLLLNAKALAYDLDFLRIAEGPLFELVQQVIVWRDEWFVRPVPERRIIGWFHDCFAVLEALLSELLADHPLWMPELRPYQFSRNIRVSPGERLEWRCRGCVIPGSRPLASRRVVKLLHRLNWFHFRLPMCSRHLPDPLRDAFAYQGRIREYNATMLPQFMALTSSLNLT